MWHIEKKERIIIGAYLYILNRVAKDKTSKTLTMT